ncbi:invasin-like protein, partial [Leucobacter luti]
MTAGASLLGVSTAAHAATYTGSVTTGFIDMTKGAPLTRIAMDNLMQTQLCASTWTNTCAYSPGTGIPNQSTGAVFMDSSGTYLISPANIGVTTSQAYGGTGTALDPFWISTTRKNATASVTKKDTYVMGAGQVRNDLTYQNLSTTTRSLQMSYWVDSYFWGSTTGRTSIGESSVSNIPPSDGTPGASSFIRASAGAKFIGGHQNGVKYQAEKYGGLTNTCVNQYGTTKIDCGTAVDNGMAIGWIVDGVAPGTSATRTYFTTFTTGLTFADVDYDAAVSTDSARIGETFEYTLTANNVAGPDKADGIRVDFPLPEGVVLVGQSGSGSYDAAAGVWSPAEVLAGNTAKITLQVQATSVGTKSAQILAASALVGLDINPFDAAGATVTEVEVTDSLNASSSKVSASPTSVVADGETSSTITVSTFGMTGAPMPSGGADVKITSTLGTVSNVVDNGDGTYTATVNSTVSGPAVISAVVDGAEISGPTVTFTPGDPATGENSSTVSVTPGTKLADGETAHTATVTLKDKNGNLISGAADRLSASSDPAAGVTIGAFTETDSGVYIATVVSTASGEKTITVTADESTVLGSGSASFIAGDVSLENTKIVLSTGDKVADGVAEHTAKVIAKDANGNPVPNTAVTFTVDGEATGSGVVQTDENGEAPIVIRSTLAGLKAVSATVGGAQIPGAGDVSFIAGALDVTNSVFSVTPGKVLADGTATHTAKVIAQDANGNPIKDVMVDFVVPAGVTASAATATDASGVTTIELTSRKSGIYSIGAEIDSVPVPGSPKNVEFSSGAAVATESSWTVTPAGPVDADGQSAYTATLTARDTNGNLVEGAVFSVEVPGAVTPSRVDWVTGPDGTVTGTFTSVKSGTFPATVSLGGDAVGSAKDLVFRAGDVSASVSSIAASPDRIKANGSTESTVTVTLKDAQGNVIDWQPTPTVVISTSAGLVSATQDNGDGTYTATLTASAAGTATLSFTIDGSNASSTATVTLVNAVAPTAPQVDPTNGTKVTGSAQPDSTVTVKDASGFTIGTGVAGSDGSFTITLSPAAGEGEVLAVTATDADDNVSAPTLVTVDAVAPDAPVVDPTNGAKVSGQAEPESFVVVKNEAGVVLGEGFADKDGNFAFPLSPAAAEGEELSVTATDAAGNTSEPTVVTVDAQAPDAPVVDPTNGAKVSGQAEPESFVVVKNEAGVVLGEGFADKDGNFAFPLSPAAAEGEELSVTATDAAGNTSEPTVVTVDAQAPDAPVVDPTNGAKVSGQAEPESFVVVKNEAGVVLGEGFADKDGNFAFPLSPAAAEGEELSVTATDAAGNTSEPTVVTVDAQAPDAPVVNPSNGQVVIGSAEPNATVNIMDEDGNVIGTGVAGTDGSFSIALDPFAKTGDVVTATATDAAGNVSVPTVVPVNSDIPQSPTVDPTNGNVVAGVSEPNMKITVLDENGDVIGTGVADDEGAFSITLDRAAAHGEQLGVIATNEADVSSAPTVVVVDAQAPDAPVVDPTDGRNVTGEAEPGATVTVKNENGDVLGTAVAQPDGSFVVSLDPAATDGEKLSVTATDPAGNESAATEVVVDAQAPDAPVVDPTNGAEVTGTTEPGATVTVKNENGDVLGTAVAQPDGSFVVSLDPAATDGEKLSVTATDPAGNESAATEVVVDAQAPDAPVVDPTNGTEVTGTTEPGAHVVVKDKDGNVIGEGDADKDGNFVLPLNPAAPHGAELSVTATDAAGNVSE